MTDSEPFMPISVGGARGDRGGMSMGGGYRGRGGRGGHDGAPEFTQQENNFDGGDNTLLADSNNMQQTGDY